MPTPHVTPSGSATSSTWQIGTYNAVTDAWTLVLDLNDRSTWYVKSYDLAQPEKVVSRSGNPRTQGERITNEVYKNRYISLTLLLRSASTIAALDTAIHNLEAALATTPFMLRFAEIGAAQYTYAIVKSWVHSIPQDPLQRAAKVKTGVTLVLECEPGLLGDKLYLDNLVVNPGFEAPSGPAVTVLNDNFASLNAYAVQSWIAAVQADSPLGWWRFDELSGTSALDSSGNAHPGTYSGGFTLGQASFNGDAASTCTQFNGTSGTASVPFAASLNPATWSVVAWVFPTDVTSNRCIYSTRGANNRGVDIFVTTTNQISVAIGNGTSYTSNATGSAPTNAWTMVTVTYDGTNIKVYNNSTLANTFAFAGYAAQTTQPTFLGSDQGGGMFFKGNLEDVAVFSGALSLAQIQALNTAGATFTLASNVATIPAGGRVAFGSPAWGALNLWQIRFQYATSLTANFALHYTDGNNALYCQVTGSAFNLVHAVAGTAHTLATTAVTPTAGTFYWLKITQFPITVGNPPQVQATLFNDSAGAIGTQVAALGPVATFDGATALSGQPQIYCSGAALAVGGNFSSVHVVQLFGPGGWLTQTVGSGPAAFAWDQTTANTYPSGPVTSFGAARIDCAPAGGVDARWTNYGGGAPAGTNAIPVAAAGNVFGLSAAMRTTANLGAGAFVSITVLEYNASGTQLTSGVAATFTGPSTSWMTLSGTYTPGANCAYLGLLLRVLDSSTGSVGATVWFDNVQCWNQTTTGQTSMPYCELRFPQSPASLLVSGLVGDLPAPAALASGSFASSLPSGTTISLLLGRRALASAAAYLVGYPHVYVGSAGYVTVLDSTAYGGYYWRTATGQTSDTAPRAQFGASVLTADMLHGVYHYLARTKTSQSVGNLGNLSSQAKVITFTGQNTASVVYPAIAGQFAASNAWTRIDHGTTFVPPYGVGAQGDISQVNLSFVALWADSTGGGSQWSYDAPALLPIDGNVLAAVYAWPTGMAPQSNKWIYIYNDGTNVVLGAVGNNNVVGASTSANWGWSQEASPLPAPQTQLGGVGTIASANASVTPTANSYTVLDPNAGVTINNIAGAPGVNQFLASVIDNSGTSYGVACSLQYIPLYLDPR